MTNVAKKPYPFGAAHTHLAHIRALLHLCYFELFLNQILDWVPRSHFSDFSSYYVYTCKILILIGASDNSC